MSTAHRKGPCCFSLLVAVLALGAGVVPARAQDKLEMELPVFEDKIRGFWAAWFVPLAYMLQVRDDRPWSPEMIEVPVGLDEWQIVMSYADVLNSAGLTANGEQFANSGYGLAHANALGRANLRGGIAPPDSGHPRFHEHADDIDYQIEADYAGLISPGLPNSSIQLGEVFGRLMNYGDGLYGGQFVAGMYSEAFFEKDMEKVVRAGLECIPEGSQYHECISDVLKWYQADPDDWQTTWQLIENKYHKNPAYRRGSCPGDGPADFNIDAKINGAYIVMGLLYGGGDPDETIIISMRCGQDSDCNPSNAAGILFTSMGYSNLPEKFTSALDREGKFSHTPYSYPKLVEVCKQLTRKIVLRHGGRIENDEDGQAVLVIPVETPRPTALEQCWEPGPIAGSRFTEEEMARIDPPPDEGQPKADETDLAEATSAFAPGWSIADCGESMTPGLHKKLAGKENVLQTHPRNRTTPCVLSRRVAVPEGKTVLHLVVGHHQIGDWTLVVKAGGKKLLERAVGHDTSEDGWMQVEVDLSEYAGSEIDLALLNQASEWMCEAAYWAKIAITTR